MKEENNTTKMSNEKYIENALRSFSFFPLSGLGVSIISAIFVLLRGREWSGMLLLYTLIPFLGFSIISIIVYLSIGKRLGMKYTFFKGKTKYLSISLIILLVIFESLIYFINPQYDLNFQKINLDDIANIETRIESNESSVYFIVYGASNCLYCTDMKTIYEESFEKNRTINTFYCDISYESYSDERLVELDVDKIPIIVSYENGEELGRLEGTTDIETLIEFIQSFEN
jgi:thiol-disulfide isomerase/thioredoxin